MTYILSSDGRDDDVSSAFIRYKEYLISVSDKFPKSAYALATSEWYFNFNDHRSPHDSWLESFTITEHGLGRRKEQRSLSLKVRLLGAYHDGYIELHYPQVFNYQMNIENGEGGHRDFRYDELRLSRSGNLIHEIEWSGYKDSARWVIEASDVEFQWYPNVAQSIY